MPVYRVDREGKTPRVVEAADPRGARNHVAIDEIKVTRIEVADAFRLASDGIKLETAGEEVPEPQPEPKLESTD